MRYLQAALWLLGLLGAVVWRGDLQSPMLVLWYNSRGEGFFLLPHSAALLDLLKTAFICKTLFFLFFFPDFVSEYVHSYAYIFGMAE